MFKATVDMRSVHMRGMRDPRQCTSTRGEPFFVTYLAPTFVLSCGWKNPVLTSSVSPVAMVDVLMQQDDSRCAVAADDVPMGDVALSRNPVLQRYISHH